MTGSVSPRLSAPVDLAGSPSGTGPLWGMQSDELNATLLEWPPGGGVAEHVNDELEVIMLVLAGSARVSLDGVRYVSVHRRRGPLLPTPRAGLFDA